jgi:hypothetical protein
MPPVTRLGSALFALVVVMGVAASPATGATRAKPKPGAYTGHASYPAGPVALSFTVNHKRTKVTSFSSDAYETGVQGAEHELPDAGDARSS